jgi:two-component system response regulator HydG
VTPTMCPNGMSDVLIADSDPVLNRMVLEKLAQRSSRGTVTATMRSARRMLGHCAWNLVFWNPSLAEEPDGRDGTEFLAALRRDLPETPVLLVSERDSSSAALCAIKAGCADFLVKPLSSEVLDRLLDRYIPVGGSRVLATVSEGSPRQVIIGRSRALGRVLEAACKAAPTSASVLLCGESGTGKELLAQLIHANSRRSEAPFIRVNCAALTESLLESELFGHEKGAFTGAAGSHRGRFERAHGGTLLLDEITETPPAFQAKLLRVLEQMCFERVGGSESIQVNVRIVSTTNQDMTKRVRQGAFRADLFYRLAGLRLTVPPLRERMEDLPELIWFYISQYAAEAGRQIQGIDRQTLELFERYRWPGNIRQLRNVIRTALILGSGPLLSAAGIDWLLEELTEEESGEWTDRSAPEAVGSLEEAERQAILAALDHTRGNQTQAAKVLGISGRTLRDRIRKYRQERVLTAG